MVKRGGGGGGGGGGGADILERHQGVLAFNYEHKENVIY